MLGIREYAAEFAGTALLLLIAVSAIIADFATRSPVVSSIPAASLRHLLTGLIVAGALTAIVYSPLGRRSGGHLNPAVTLAFLSLNKITVRSAATYVAAQIAGALAGATLAWLIWRNWAASVNLGATTPRVGAPWAAAGAETAMTFLLVCLILNLVDRPRLIRFTAAAAGALLAFFIVVEAPVSGASLNPARTLGPAIVGGHYAGLWIYLLGPPTGGLAAAFAYRHRRSTVACAKLYHTNAVACGFLDCQYTPPDRRVTARGRAPAGQRG